MRVEQSGQLYIYCGMQCLNAVYRVDNQPGKTREGAQFRKRRKIYSLQGAGKTGLF